MSRRPSVAHCRLTRKATGNPLVARTGKIVGLLRGQCRVVPALRRRPPTPCVLRERAGDLVVAALPRLAAPRSVPGCGVQGRLLRDGERAAALLFLPLYAQPHSDVTNTRRSGSGDRCLPLALSRAGSTCASGPRPSSDQTSGRQHMRASGGRPITCRHVCPRKEPLPSCQRSECVCRAVQRQDLRAGRDNSRDSLGDNREAVSRDLVYT